jgi:hypothetical protein
MLDGFLRRQQQPQHVEVKMLVKVLGIDRFQRSKLIDARVVHKDVELPERLLRLGKETANVLDPGNVGLDGDGFPARLPDAPDDCLCPGLAGGIIDHYRGTGCRQVLGNRGADALRRPRDHRDLSFQFLRHDRAPFSC